MKTNTTSLLFIAAAVILTGGTYGLAQQNKACVNFNLGCQGYTCNIQGDATCTNDLGIQYTWNRLTQNNGVAYLLGDCQDGSGSCSLKDFACNADKYYNANPNDQACDDNTYRCTDEGTSNGCKDS